MKLLALADIHLRPDRLADQAQVLERIAERLVRRTVTQDNGCLIFQGYVLNSGYATMWSPSHGSKQLVRRLAHELYIGPIPDGYQVDHLCFNRLCVNPAHLEAVTPLENTRRAAARQTHCVNGHEFTPENTRMVRNGTVRACKACDAARQREYRARDPERSKANQRAFYYRHRELNNALRRQRHAEKRAA